VIGVIGVIGANGAGAAVAVHAGTALRWATFTIGEEPDVECILEVVRKLIAAS
jgi:hypothetical protein